jgi:hypothetical protein
MASLTVTWRDENYGRYSGCVAAFRLYDTVALSDRAIARVHGKARRAGFEFCPARCAWIAYSADAPVRLVEALQALGHSVTHEGRWPDGPPATRERS